MVQVLRCDTASDLPTSVTTDEISTFLEEHLGIYRDKKSAILKAIDYALSSSVGQGGFVLLAFIDTSLVGAVVVNRTGMVEYIPEFILVYIAVDESQRGLGIGKSLVERTQKEAGGTIALHVEYDNPAMRLYERLGFTSKYAEMRFDPSQTEPLN